MPCASRAVRVYWVRAVTACAVPCMRRVALLKDKPRGRDGERMYETLPRPPSAEGSGVSETAVFTRQLLAATTVEPNDGTLRTRPSTR